MWRVLTDIEREVERSTVKHGEQAHLPDGTSAVYRGEASGARYWCDLAAHTGRLTWRHILREEVFEAFAETDPHKLRAELVQVAAVAAKWIESLDRRG
jgi:hypothetical protein